MTEVKLMESSIESALDTTRFVNFANEKLHIQRIIPSATQEVLFSCAPEASVSIGLCPQILDDHGISIRNVRRYVEYGGTCPRLTCTAALHPTPSPVVA
ncbi:hypothetical protein H310_02666 [Aphanomyces invadans]|uniref:Uncharacterized protein n=1 Tax=Aphanomyces invadans TaxID=157072 RepID=A0A024ULD9_9STRA|nr:hypothetical protein H310_02666 [Aphanomyces invadans]ETW06393.1 hypothetical protein H310_02666 [Aphanomyces invadans]|eukprot:XP_008864468.1 hypothetical protein H310_02666 [Aphanomyces invadans]